eukprot:c23223_g1_i2 orf=257-1192(-)
MQQQSNASVAKFPAMDATEVIIGNSRELERKKNMIRCSGLSRLQVIADFDMTLTKSWINGRRGQSSHSLLSQGNPEYDLKRKQLFEYYYPLEICPTIPIDEKTRLMEEWWEKTHGLLVDGGLNQTAIAKSVANATVEFRDGVRELFEFLEEEGVPVLIFSAGLADIIEEVMYQKLHRTFRNIRIVSNRMEFNDDGNLVRFIGKTIHVLNKNERAIEMADSLHNQDSHLTGGNLHNVNSAAILQGRTNMLLLGDHLGDLGMSDGFEYETRVSIGFLNENVDEWLETYKQAFDIVVLNDGSMSCAIELVHQLK